MSIISEIKINDLLRYELINGVSILEELGVLNLSVVVDMIMLGNNCGADEAELILNRALENNSFEEVVKKLVYEILGREPSEGAECVDEKLNSLTDIIDSFYTELQIVDGKLTLSELEGMSMGRLYAYADGVNKRYIFNKNREMHSQYMYVAMFMQALAGKLRDCPQFEEDGSIHKKTLQEKIAEHRMNGGA